MIFYNIEDASEKIKPIIETMQSYFSSVPGTYYSDSLFYMSLALHKIAPENQSKVILLDIDLKFKTNISQLYRLFSKWVKSYLSRQFVNQSQ